MLSYIHEKSHVEQWEQVNRNNIDRNFVNTNKIFNVSNVQNLSLPPHNICKSSTININSYLLIKKHWREFVMELTSSKFLY